MKFIGPKFKGSLGQAAPAPFLVKRHEQVQPKLHYDMDSCPQQGQHCILDGFGKMHSRAMLD